MRHRNTFNSHGTLSTDRSKERNRYTYKPLPSVDDIAAVAEILTEENAIFIAQTEIDCLDELSLEGDLPDDLSEEE